MNNDALSDLHLSVAEMHAQIRALARRVGMKSADMALVVKWLDDARGHLSERHYDQAVLALASAAKAIARARKLRTPTPDANRTR
jgi:hypothetical protein